MHMKIVRNDGFPALPGAYKPAIRNSGWTTESKVDGRTEVRQPAPTAATTANAPEGIDQYV